MSVYTNAKPSFQIEDQLPKYVLANGPKFVNFLKAYYEWLEKKMVILTLKSSNVFDEQQIIDQRLSVIGEHYQLLTEEEYLLADENVGVVTDIDYQNTTRSLVLNGINQYGYINHSIIDIENSWTLSFWIRVTDLPSTVRLDYDIITLSNLQYMCLFKVSKDANEVQAVLGSTTLKTGIYLNKNIWNFVTIRYDITTNRIYYDVQNEYDQSNSFSSYLNLLPLSLYSNMFVVGCDLYNSRNFFDGYIDEIASWNEFRVDNEIISLYNNGNPTNLLDTYNDSTFNTLITTFDGDVDFDYTSNGTIVANYIKFDEGNTTVAINSIDDYNNLLIFQEPSYSIEVPINTIAFITEDEEVASLIVDVVSLIKYDNIPENILGNRLLVFCEHVSGKLETEIPIYVTPEGMEVVIDSYIDAKTPLNVINNIENYQEIDYALKYGNYVYNTFYQNCWKELMYGFPLYLHDTFDTTIKDLIAKNIKDFYNTKGTLKSFKYLFKILYNEDLELGTDIYSTGNFQYVIKTDYASAQKEILEVLNLVAHPVGFSVEFIQK
jgi:hypothetical protein